MRAKFSLRSGCRVAHCSTILFVGLVFITVMLAAAPLRADTYSWVVPSGHWSIRRETIRLEC